MKTNRIDKVVLITGASSGFGKGVAEKLIEKGYTVFAAARNMEKMEPLRKVGAHLLQMDVTSEEDVKAGVDKIIKEYGRIDVLFNNAGYGNFGVIEDIPMKDVEYQFDVNVMGVIRAIKAVLPYMRRQKSGRIINTSSVVGRVSMPCGGFYSATKYAVEAISDALRVETKGFGIKVSIIEPGPVKTGFEKVVFDKLDSVDISDDYKPIQESFNNVFRKMYADAPGTESTVRAVINAIEAKRPKIRYKTTPSSGLLIFLKSITCARFFDWCMERTLSAGKNK